MSPADISQKFVIRRKLREVGNYLTIFEADEPALERKVELRVLTALITQDSEAHAKFKAEYKALAALDHPGVLKILDVGHTGDRVYYVTDVPPGVTLSEAVARGPLGPERVVDIGLQLCEALEYLHAKGIVHRSLSLGGVRLQEGTGRVLLTDFSLLKATADAPTMNALVDLDAFDLLPERVAGRPADARSDVFLAAGVLYGLLAGFEPLSSKGLARAPDYAFEPLTELNPECPEELDAAIRKALSKEPAARQQTAAQLGQELEAAKRRLEIRRTSRAIAVPIPAARASSAHTAVAPAPGPTRGPWIAAAAGAILLAGVGASFYSDGEADKPAAAPRRERPAQVVMIPSVRPPGEEGAPAKDPTDIGALAAEVAKLPTSEKNFVARWDALRAWADLPMPPGKAAPFAPVELTTIRLRFHRDAKKASAELDALIEKAAE